MLPHLSRRPEAGEHPGGQRLLGAAVACRVAGGRDGRRRVGGRQRLALERAQDGGLLALGAGAGAAWAGERGCVNIGRGGCALDVHGAGGRRLAGGDGVQLHDSGRLGKERAK